MRRAPPDWPGVSLGGATSQPPQADDRAERDHHPLLGGDKANPVKVEGRVVPLAEHSFQERVIAREVAGVGQVLGGQGRSVAVRQHLPILAAVAG